MADERAGKNLLSHEIVYAEPIADIVNHVSAGIAALPENFDKDTLNRAFLRDLNSKITYTQNVLPFAFDALTVIYGQDFTSLDETDKRKKVYEVSTQEANKGGSVIGNFLQQRYDEFIGSDDGSGWEEFVNVFQMLGATVTHRVGNHMHIIAPFPVVYQKTLLDLPALFASYSIPEDTVRSKVDNNNVLQLNLARHFSVVVNDDTWEDFFRRSQPKIFGSGAEAWSELDQAENDYPETVIAKQVVSSSVDEYGKLLHEGAPFYYSVPIGFGARLGIQLMSRSKHRNLPIDGLVTKGGLTMRMRLIIPTDLLADCLIID